MFASSVVITRQHCEHSGRPGNMPYHVREGERGSGSGRLGTRYASKGQRASVRVTRQGGVGVG
jgi:hypothetical protein